MTKKTKKANKDLNKDLDTQTKDTTMNKTIIATTIENDKKEMNSLVEVAQRINELTLTIAVSSIKVGELLSQAKASFKVAKDFINWSTINCHMGKATVYKYISVYEEFKNTDVINSRTSMTVLYSIVSINNDAVKKEVKDIFTACLDAGETVTNKDIKEIIQEVTGETSDPEAQDTETETESSVTPSDEVTSTNKDLEKALKKADKEKEEQEAKYKKMIDKANKDKDQSITELQTAQEENTRLSNLLIKLERNNKNLNGQVESGLEAVKQLELRLEQAMFMNETLKSELQDYKLAQESVDNDLEEEYYDNLDTENDDCPFDMDDEEEEEEELNSTPVATLLADFQTEYLRLKGINPRKVQKNTEDAATLAGIEKVSHNLFNLDGEHVQAFDLRELATQI